MRASRFIGDAAQGRVVGANQAGPPDWPEATQPSQSGQLNGVVRTGGSHPAFGGRPTAASWYQAYPLALTGPATTKPSCPALIVPSWVPAVPAVARTVRPSTVDLARPSTLIVGAAGEGLGVSSGGEAVAEAVRDGCGVSVGLPVGSDLVFGAAQPARNRMIARVRILRTFDLRSRRELGDQRDAPDGSST